LGKNQRVNLKGFVCANDKAMLSLADLEDNCSGAVGTTQKIEMLEIYISGRPEKSIVCCQ